MCGIIGMAGNLEYKDKELFRDMFITLPLRGEDSTGMFTVKKKEAAATVAKVVGTPFDLFPTKGFDNCSFFDKRVAIGHCRKATVGAITKHTAHPYQFEHITGVHNGTLRNWRDFPGDKHATDSATLYDYMSRDGYKTAIEATDGAYALVWWDEREQTLNIIRNKERPLFYAFSEKGDKILFASERWMIEVNASRNGFKLMDLTPNDEYVTRTLSVPEDELFKLKLAEDGVNNAIRFLEDEATGSPEIVKGGVNLPVKAYAPFHSNRTTYTPYGNPSGGGRVPWSWETDPNNPKNKPQPVVEATLTPVESGTTTPPVANLPAVVSTPTQPTIASPARRPTLSLVQTSKSGGSEQSSASSDASDSASLLDDPIDDVNAMIKRVFGDKPATGAWGPCINGNGNLLFNAEEYNELIDPNCVWCLTPQTFEEMREGSKFGMWVDDERFCCKECMENEINLAQYVCQ